MGRLAIHVLLLIAVIGIVLFRLRRRGFPWLSKSLPMARYYDADTRRVARVPQCELTTQMVEAHVPGVEGVVWVDPLEMPVGAVRVSPTQSDRPA